MLHLLIRKKGQVYFVFFSAAVIALMAGASQSEAGPADAPSVIVNSSVIDTHLTRNTLRSIFTLRLTRWADGTPVQVFVLADSDPVHQQFSKKALGVFPYQLRQVWDRVVYSGTGEAPVELENQEAMYSRVAQTPGAIGYLADDKRKDGVRYVVE